MTTRILRNIVAFAFGVVIALVVITPFAAETQPTLRQYVTSVTHKMTGNTGICSAVMIAPGRALTAAHCTNMESPVLQIGGVNYPITEAYANPDRDLAVLIVPGAPCPCAEVRETAVQPGEWIVIVGYPYDLAKVVTYGEVQARVVTPADGREYVLTTGASLPGNSGGGVFDMSGYLVGIMALGSDTGTMSMYVELRAMPVK